MQVSHLNEIVNLSLSELDTLERSANDDNLDVLRD